MPVPPSWGSSPRPGRCRACLAADLGRAALLGLIPVVALMGTLRIEPLYAVAFLIGTLTLVFDVAHRSFLPSLVHHDQLVEGNSKLELSRSAAEIAGPGLAGALVHILTAPIAMAVDALSFLWSALFIQRIRAEEIAPAETDVPSGIWAGVVEGMRLIVDSPLLRAIGGSIGTASLFSNALEAALLLYLSRELGLPPVLLGIIFASGNVGFLVGALLPEHLTRRLGLGPVIIGALALVDIGDLAIPLASGPLVVVVPLIVVAHVLFGVGLTVFNVNQVSLRQSITPGHLQGRMNAGFRFAVAGVAPLGALLGGALGETIGLRPTLVVGAVGELLAIVWLWCSPVRGLQAQPTAEEQTSGLTARR